MVQQTTESNISGNGLGNSESDLPSGDRQPPIAAKKTALRELQNENRILVPHASKIPPLKDKVGIFDPVKVSGTKRPSTELSVNPFTNQSPSSNPANSHLVYVRRKSDIEIGKSSSPDSTNISVQGSQSISTNGPEEAVKHQHQIVGPKISCYPAFATLPITSPPISSSPKPSIPFPLSLSVAKLGSADSKYQSVASSSLTKENSQGMKNLHWEERFMKLQQLLRSLDQADHKDYLQMLRSLSSVDLSWHAVELERRSIQLSLEEAKEMQRVGLLNVLGKTVKN